MGEITKDKNRIKWKKFMVNLLLHGRYRVNDYTGKTNFFYNILDLIFLSVYFGYSLHNAWLGVGDSSTISEVTLIINILVMVRLWVKHCKEAKAYVIEESKKKVEFDSIGKCCEIGTTVYDRKRQGCFVVGMLSFFLIIYSKVFGYTGNVDPKALVGVIVSLLTFFDGVLSIIEDMFVAIPIGYKKYYE